MIINGKRIDNLKGKELRDQRKKIGIIFQHFNLLWSRTVLENIEFPLELVGVAKEERRKASIPKRTKTRGTTLFFYFFTKVDSSTTNSKSVVSNYIALCTSKCLFGSRIT